MTMVTLLTQPGCALCEHAKQVLARVGEDHPVEVTEIDLASPRGRDLASQARVMFAPGILLEGRPFSYGPPSGTPVTASRALPAPGLPADSERSASRGTPERPAGQA